MFSVGGGNLEKNVSPNLVPALKLAKKVGARVIGVVGRDGGYTAKVADACVIVPTVNPENSHAAFGSVPGRRLASAGLASEAEGQPDQVGIDGPQDEAAAVFLDRDGVLNRAVVRDGKPYPPASVERAGDPAGRARGAGGVARRRVSADRRDQPARRRARHADAGGGRGDQRRALRAALPIDEISDVLSRQRTMAATAASRSPGALLTAAARFTTSILATSFMVGDRWRDIEAGQRRAAGRCSSTTAMPRNAARGDRYRVRSLL